MLSRRSPKALKFFTLKLIFQSWQDKCDMCPHPVAQAYHTPTHEIGLEKLVLLAVTISPKGSFDFDTSAPPPDPNGWRCTQFWKMDAGMGPNKNAKKNQQHLGWKANDLQTKRHKKCATPL